MRTWCKVEEDFFDGCNDELVAYEYRGDEIVETSVNYALEKFHIGQWVVRRTGKHGHGVYTWSNIVTFDIETTSEELDGVMYIWMMCLEKVIVTGRTWQSWLKFMDMLLDIVDYDNFPYRGDSQANIQIWVHNLSFEFQFIRTFMHFEHVFSKTKRKVVSAEAGPFEFRCSYMMTNMSLAKLCQTTPGVTHFKADGDMDYRKVRYPHTPLTLKELNYCLRDVLSLYEIMQHYYSEDSFRTLPLTSTGFVRREYRDACTRDRNHMSRFNRLKLDEYTYLLCKEAARGGVAGSAAEWTDDILTNIDSYDKKSSYPYTMMMEYFPGEKFHKVPVSHFTDALNECCLIDITFYGFRLKEWVSIPYVSTARCRFLAGDLMSGNGKLYSCSEVRMTITELDFSVIESMYQWDDMDIRELWCAGMDKLSKSFRTVLRDWFKLKEEIKGTDEYMYMKTKNKVNSSFGMMLTDIIQPDIAYDNDTIECWREVSKPVADCLAEFYNSKKSFLSYQDGVWVTAHARRNLYDGVLMCGERVVQVDTDSVKGIDLDGSEFNQLNQQIIKKCESNDVPGYVDVKGKRIYLGVWEHDAHYDEFLTFGAKKYMYTENGEFHVTVSGLAKSAAKWLSDNVGGIAGVRAELEVPPGYSGRTSSTYHDVANPYWIERDGRRYLQGSSVSIHDVGYTFNMTDEWQNLIDNILQDNI